MKCRVLTRTGFRLICVACFAASLFPMQELVSAQDNTNSSPKTEQQKLAEAQTRYYEAQAAKLDQEGSFSQRILNLSAFLAALVAVLSLVLNYSSTLRTQRDSQFLEALKRFGDKDSPTVRSSATGLLAKLSNQKGIIFWWKWPNFDIALDQLMTGLLLEDNDVCLTSIKDALRELTTYVPLKPLERMRKVNLAVQKDMVEALAAFLATKPPANETSLPTEEQWNDAAASTPYERDVLYTLASRDYYEDIFLRLYKAALHEYSAMNRAMKSDRSIAARKALRIAGERLSLNVEVYCIMLGTNPFRDIQRELDRHLDIYRKITVPAMNLEKVFLVGADLSQAQLQGVNLSNAQLQRITAMGVDLRRSQLVGAQLRGANLYSANLQGASLARADLRPRTVWTHSGSFEAAACLQHAHLEDADLTSAHLQGLDLKEAFLAGGKLHGVEIDSFTNLKGSNWWQSNFQGEGFNHGISERVQAELFSRYGDEVPTNISEVHPSVREFMKTNHPAKKSEA